MARMQEMLRKEVINVFTGEKLGFAIDIDIDPETGRIAAIILPEKKVSSFFGRGGEVIVPWSDVSRISDDLIMINTDTRVQLVRKA